MARKKLTIEQQISVLKEAKKKFKTAEKDMCECIIKSLTIYDIQLKSNKNVNRYIPTFTFNHICKLTKGTKFFLFIAAEQLRVFDLLIKELEEKLTK